MEELLAKHRREKKDLQARITQKKKSASKKTRKGVNDECDTLERDLLHQQEAEIAALVGGNEAISAENLDENENQQVENHRDGDEVETTRAAEDGSTAPPSQSLSELSISIPSDDPNPQQQRKPNRNKARLARRAAERDALAASAEEEAQSLPDLKAAERERMLASFKSRGLVEKEVRADGHCLYSAIADGLKVNEIGLKPRLEALINARGANGADGNEDDYRIVRRSAADYITSHPDDFVPFLEEDLDSYTRKVAETGEWGGQLELLALAKAYGVDISVIQGDGRVEEIEGEGEDRKRLWLAYYKHGFGLGEHYNSLRKAP